MNDKSYSPTSTLAWSNLETQASVANGVRITELFDADPQRVENLSVTSGELYLDFSKNLLSDKVWSALLALAGQSPLQSHRAAMFSGEPINNTENRAVLHAALRAELEDANGSCRSHAEANTLALQDAYRARWAVCAVGAFLVGKLVGACAFRTVVAGGARRLEAAALQAQRDRPAP